MHEPGRRGVSFQTRNISSGRFERHQGPVSLRGSPRQASIQRTEPFVPVLQTQWSLGAVNRPTANRVAGLKRDPPTALETTESLSLGFIKGLHVPSGASHVQGQKIAGPSNHYIWSRDKTTSWMSSGFLRIARIAVKTPAADVSTDMLGAPRFSAIAAVLGR
jgi:hypothetical protein